MGFSRTGYYNTSTVANQMDKGMMGGMMMIDMSADFDKDCGPGISYAEAGTLWFA